MTATSNVGAAARVDSVLVGDGGDWLSALDAARASDTAATNSGLAAGSWLLGDVWSFQGGYHGRSDHKTFGICAARIYFVC